MDNLTPEEESQASRAQAMVKAVYEDRVAEINGRSYHFLNLTHAQRTTVFAYYSKISSGVGRGDLSFIDSDEYKSARSIIMNTTSIGESVLSKLGDAHWEKYPGDFIPFTLIALQVISYPFTVDAPTD